MTAPDIWMQTGTCRALDLISPTAAGIDLMTDVAEALARTARFSGHVRAGVYSVAQHTCLGTDAILKATGSLTIARAFHLHDAHDFAIGNIGTPTVEALEERVGQELAKLMPHMADQAARIGRACFRKAHSGQKRDLDAAIYGAAGHPYPPAPEILQAVKAWDLRMLRTERDHLFNGVPFPWADAVEAAEPVPLTGRISIWPWPKAADEWRARLLMLFPHLVPSADAA
ncbi:hypothetical protein GCM10007301_15140 [Azorhizobium oxalatiphilum]|uniref:HD domain-containing protein n=1 Tax=Azorhizobium oxalatiphilum TaxID=980631 RepID=A0A917BTR2_9HYPH|nr:hypothetical protein [Azorhizobium oxalatiphilum]GGF56459.1 hypothetical protein GCM10007301_15140 [Azorhizobium oxalatiphilum]